MYSTPRYAASDTMTILAIVTTNTITAVVRCAGSLRSMRGQWTSDGARPRARRRRSIQAPNGMSARPKRKTPGRTRKKTIPRYGLVCQPKRSARKTMRNSTALIVVSTMPTTEIGLRIRRTLRTIPRSLPQRRVQDEHEERDAERQADPAHEMAASDVVRRRRRDAQTREVARGLEPVVL